MRRSLPALIFGLIAFALTFAVNGLVKAEFSAPLQPNIVATTFVMQADGTDTDCHHSDCLAGQSGCVCCPASGLAAVILAPDITQLVILQAAHGMPPNSSRDGITVRPVTGPPKLSV